MTQKILISNMAEPVNWCNVSMSWFLVKEPTCDQSAISAPLLQLCYNLQSRKSRAKRPGLVPLPDTRRGSRLVRPDAHKLLAEVGALQETHEGARGTLETLGDELLVLHLALAHPARHVAQEISVARGEIGHDEAAEGQPLGQDRAHHGARPFRRDGLGVVIMRDQAAHRHAREIVQKRKHRFEHRAADILEIDVDALRAGLLQLCWKIGIAMIEAFVEAKLLFDEVAFVLAAGDADRTRALDLRDRSEEHTSE